MGSPKKIYWDTSVFLCFLAEEEHERRRICEDVLRHARDGNVELITSMFTIVEVIRPKGIKHPTPLTDDQVLKLDGMFRWPWIHKIQVHEELARAAVHLSRQFGLKPPDSIHAATAIEEKADELQCWDRDFSKLASLINVTPPGYTSKQLALIEVESPIGPTPEDFKTVSTPSTVTEPPSEQSPGVEPETAPSPALVRPEDPQAAPAPPPPGSSPASAQKPPSAG